MQPRKLPNSDRSLESLEARLRALPRPTVPSDLEARIVSAMPSELPRLARTARSRRPALWAGTVVGLAAACALAVLLWPMLGGKRTDPRLLAIPKPSSDLVTLQRPSDSLGVTAWLEARRGLEGTEKPAFIWPIQEKTPLMVSIAIPSDLFD